MRSVALLLTLSVSLSSVAKPEPKQAPSLEDKTVSCAGWIYGVNTYDQLVKGKLVEKTSRFPILGWGPAMQFSEIEIDAKAPVGVKLYLAVMNPKGTLLKEWAWNEPNDSVSRNTGSKTTVPSRRVDDTSWKGLLQKFTPAGKLKIKLESKQGERLCEESVEIEAGH